MNWKKLIGEIYDDTKIYLVDGDYVRDNISINSKDQFVEGGHGYVYDWVPKDEIWVEEMLNKEDQAKNGMHEIYEYTLMKYIKEEYNDAHEKTLVVENIIKKLSHESIKSKETNEKRDKNKMGLLTRMYESQKVVTIVTDKGSKMTGYTSVFNVKIGDHVWIHNISGASGEWVEYFGRVIKIN